MDDGWGAVIAVLIIIGACLYMEWRDRKSGRYPRDWRD